MTEKVTHFKQDAGEHVATLIESGMVVGLASGSTAIFATRRVAARLPVGALHDGVGIATSRTNGEAARELGIPMLTDDLPREIDLTIDGADEVDPAMNLIEGDGALLREKIVAQASRREGIVVVAGKLSPGLGTHWPLPLEVLVFGCRSQVRLLERLDSALTPRTGDGGLYRTDQGNIVLDSEFGRISAPAVLVGTKGAGADPPAHGRESSMVTQQQAWMAELDRTLCTESLGFKLCVQVSTLLGEFLLTVCNRPDKGSRSIVSPRSGRAAVGHACHRGRRAGGAGTVLQPARAGTATIAGAAASSVGAIAPTGPAPSRPINCTQCPMCADFRRR
jgi:ribose 5-phosphate isomerase A